MKVIRAIGEHFIGSQKRRICSSSRRIGSFIGHKGAVWGATITGNAELAATAGSDFTAKLWDANTGAELQTFEHKHIVRSVDFSTINKEWLLTGSNEKLIKIYDVTAPAGLFISSILARFSIFHRFLRTGENLQWTYRCSEKGDIHGWQTNLYGIG